MDKSPLAPEILFHVGPVPIDLSVATTWVIIVLLASASWLGMRRARVHAGTFQTILETIVETIATQIESVITRNSERYIPLLATLFIFIVCANLAAVIPGVKPPTASIETPAALAVIVFFSVHYFGVRARGAVDYLRRYTKPNLLLLPLNILSEITRVFSLMVRLFGNMMSHELVIAIIVLLAGLLLPIPFMLLGILIGLIQAYIFTVLAAVFIGAAVNSEEVG